MKVLFIDVETSPNVAYTWGLFNQNIGVNQLVSTSSIICFSAKWQGERKMHFRSDPQDGHEAMIRAAHELLDEADVVVHYNGQNFDIPHFNREFLELGLKPPSTYTQIDLLLVARSRFRFTSNKLEHVSEQLGLGGKLKHEGFDLWRKCMAGDRAAWRKMEKYNRRDVVVLEGVYDMLLPWIPAHPSRTLYDGTGGCPTCGDAGPLVRRGFYFTKVSKFQRWSCNSCGGWFRSSRRESGVPIQGAVL